LQTSLGDPLQFILRCSTRKYQLCVRCQKLTSYQARFIQIGLSEEKPEGISQPNPTQPILFIYFILLHYFAKWLNQSCVGSGEK
jgi:hypothetical protein